MVTRKKTKSDQLIHRAFQLEYKRLTIIQHLERATTWPPEVDFSRARVEVKTVPVRVGYSDVYGGVHYSTSISLERQYSTGTSPTVRPQMGTYVTNH